MWDDYVLRVAGGLTILKPGSGKWVSPTDLLHQDRVIPVRIGCTEDQIRKIASFTIKHYHQEAVMFYRVADKVSIVYE